MPQLVDPADALVQFQQAIAMDAIPLQPCELDPSIVVCLDKPNGKVRFTHLDLDGRTVTAMVMLVAGEHRGGIPCFDIGYAVPKPFRGQGRAARLVAQAIREMKHGLGRAEFETFYVEAVVGLDNAASQKVAAASLASKAVPTRDEYTELPALQYSTKYETRRLSSV
ncbi:GNAT family N-acetyltransferase [Neorhizobium sp. NCHU2750]|uniref:GNAT family N-acetyltransferase n=1 Tax=Neorhizobium sp. NCHU2750 TaxID=1825976 RepID=UPI000E74C209|nr:hypothetical protein NCHU2750_57390 [Neorhizobium sp. NCHU2750]